MIKKLNKRGGNSISIENYRSFDLCGVWWKEELFNLIYLFDYRDAKYILRSKGKVLTAGGYETEIQAVFRTGSGTPLYIQKWDNEFLYEIGYIHSYSGGSTKKCPFYGKESGEGPVFSCTRNIRHRSKFFIKSNFFILPFSIFSTIAMHN